MVFLGGKGSGGLGSRGEVRRGGNGLGKPEGRRWSGEGVGAGRGGGGCEGQAEVVLVGTVAVEADPGLLEGEALGVEFEAEAVELEAFLVKAGAKSQGTGAAEGLNIGDQGVDDARFGAAAGRQAAEEVGEEEGGGLVVQGGGSGGIEILEVLAEGADLGEGVLVSHPVGKPTRFPVIDILVVDGTAGEEGGEEGLDLGEGIEPGHEGGSRLVVEQAEVELIAEGPGEAGDLAAPGASRDRGGGGPRDGGRRGDGGSL